jgi:hypothetical protein
MLVEVPSAVAPVDSPQRVWSDRSTDRYPRQRREVRRPTRAALGNSRVPQTQNVGDCSWIITIGLRRAAKKWYCAASVHHFGPFGFFVHRKSHLTELVEPLGQGTSCNSWTVTVVSLDGHACRGEATHFMESRRHRNPPCPKHPPASVGWAASSSWRRSSRPRSTPLAHRFPTSSCSSSKKRSPRWYSIWPRARRDSSARLGLTLVVTKEHEGADHRGPTCPIAPARRAREH